MKDCYIFTLACVVFVILLFFNKTIDENLIPAKTPPKLHNRFIKDFVKEIDTFHKKKKGNAKKINVTVY